MSNADELNLQEVKEATKPTVNLAFLFKIVIPIMFLAYLYSIFFGQSSIGVMLDAKERESKLLNDYNTIQNENQKLQKKHFELIQLTPEVDSF